MPEATSCAASTPSAALAADSADPYELILTPPARRAITERLPEAVAAAVINFLTTTLIDEPRRVGKPLRGDLAGIWSARRGSYRVLYRLREDPCEVIVVRIEHRRDAYRPL
ncbi:MAG: type II toxin-antitoxin system RelE/ParE family toxin [Actinomycetota bacterium]|nr:type II toxin-antitoxin system RelE/ParE family toxin [Actinomycetota bacterium]